MSTPTTLGSLRSAWTISARPCWTYSASTPSERLPGAYCLITITHWWPLLMSLDCCTNWDGFTAAPAMPGTVRKTRAGGRCFIEPPSGSCAQKDTISPPQITFTITLCITGMFGDGRTGLGAARRSIFQPWDVRKLSACGRNIPFGVTGRRGMTRQSS